MRIDLQRAFSSGCLYERECFVCERDFTPRCVGIVAGPHGELICDWCFLYLDARRESEPIDADWPTWDQYNQLAKLFTEPMFASCEESEEAERLGLYDDFVEASYLA